VIPRQAFCALLLLAPGASASAADAWRVGGQFGAVSDYRYRGASLTDGAPALQAQLTATSSQEVYATLWASNIRDLDARGARRNGLELSASLGRAFDIGRTRFDLAVTRYAYPGRGAGYLEFPVSVSRSFGRARLTAGAAWAPPQPGLGGRANDYVYLAGMWSDPDWPIAPRVSLGREHGAFARDKIDWSAGFAAEYGRVGLSLDLVGASEGAGSTLVAALQQRF